MIGFVYILQSEETKKFYIGSTDNIKRRIYAHFSGNTPTTKRMKRISLVFSQKYKNLSEARKIELWLKKLKRRDYIEKIIKDGYIKKNLGM